MKGQQRSSSFLWLQLHVLRLLKWKVRGNSALASEKKFGARVFFYLVTVAFVCSILPLFELGDQHGQRRTGKIACSVQ
jgi:hypothetical protein